MTAIDDYGNGMVLFKGNGMDATFSAWYHICLKIPTDVEIMKNGEIQIEPFKSFYNVKNSMEIIDFLVADRSSALFKNPDNYTLKFLRAAILMSSIGGLLRKYNHFGLAFDFQNKVCHRYIKSLSLGYFKSNSSEEDKKLFDEEIIGHFHKLQKQFYPSEDVYQNACEQLIIM